MFEKNGSVIMGEKKWRDVAVSGWHGETGVLIKERDEDSRTSS